MDIISRLKLFLDHNAIPVTRFADDCRIPRPTLSQLLSGRNKKVSDEVISKIHEAYPQLSVMWLMFGEGQMLTGPSREVGMPQSQRREVGMSQSQRRDEAPRVQSINVTTAPEPQRGMGSSRISFDMDFAEPSRTNVRTETPPREETSGQPQLIFDDITDDIPADDSPTEDSEHTNLPEREISGGGRRVISIVVYYDDMSYESFLPDPSHKSPFIPRG